MPKPSVTILFVLSEKAASVSKSSRLKITRHSKYFSLFWTTMLERFIIDSSTYRGNSNTCYKFCRVVWILELQREREKNETSGWLLASQISHCLC